MDYCTVAQVREELVKDATQSASFGADDPAIAERIPRAGALIDTYCGHSFNAGAVVREVRRGQQVAIDGDGVLVFTVARAFVSTVTAVELTTNFASWATLDISALDIVPTGPTAYTVNVYGARPPASRGQRMAIRVSYVSGWAEIPADLQHAASRLTAFLFMKRQAPFEAVASAAGAVYLPTSMPKDIRDALAPFKRVAP